MIRIGRYVFGFVHVSMIAVFIVSCACAVVAAFRQVRPDWPVPLSELIMANVCVALAVTLMYGIVLHFVMAIAGRRRRRKS